ncbi:hypothetical protein WN943_006042 [Citrus x changshan-huyou]
MVFGQVVIGPSGSGKTTYCNGMSQFLSLVGRNECAVNIEDLIRLSDVMMEYSLGPNGGLVYCMDYLEKNIDWLQSKLEPLLKVTPGSMLVLCFSHCLRCYIWNFPMSMSCLIDLIENHGKLAFNLEYYTDVQDLSYLQHALGQDPRSAKYRSQMVNLLSNSSLLHSCFDDICGAASYLRPAYVTDKESVAKLVRLIDKSNGYIFAGMDASAFEFSKIAVRDVDWDYFGYASFHLFSIMLFSYS